jgi:hypothetical protein
MMNRSQFEEGDSPQRTQRAPRRNQQCRLPTGGSRASKDSFSISLLSLLTPVQKHCSVCSVASVANLPCLVKFSEGGYFTAVRRAASSAMPCEGAVTDFGKHSDSGDQAR